MHEEGLAKEIPHSIWPNVVEEIKHVKEKFDLQVKIAIVGFGKAGKSTLFNGIFRTKPPRDWSADRSHEKGEARDEIRCYLHGYTRLWDQSCSPGGNQEGFARATPDHPLHKRDVCNLGRRLGVVPVLQRHSPSLSSLWSPRQM